MYEFKAGDKGLTRNGKEYEVLMVDDRLVRPVIVIIDNDGYARCRRKDGKQMESAELPRDILPPKRFKYINLFFSIISTDRVLCSDHDDADTALKERDSLEVDGYKMIDVARPVEIPQ